MSKNTLTDASGITRFSHPAAVVNEAPGDIATRDAISLEFEAIRQSSPPVLFILRSDSASNAHSLQISPDCIASLRRTVHRHTQDNLPPSIHPARRQLGQRQNLVRLQFQLHKHGQVVGPASPTEEGSPHLPDSNGGAVLKTLSTAPMFSIYMADAAFSKSEYNIFFKELKPLLENAPGPPQLLPPQLLPSVEQEGDIPSIEDTRPPPSYDFEHEVSTPRPPASCASTVAVPTPPEYRRVDDTEASQPDAGQDHASDNDRLRSPDGAASPLVSRGTSTAVALFRFCCRSFRIHLTFPNISRTHKKAFLLQQQRHPHLSRGCEESGPFHTEAVSLQQQRHVHRSEGREETGPVHNSHRIRPFRAFLPLGSYQGREKTGPFNNHQRSLRFRVLCPQPSRDHNETGPRYRCRLVR